MLSYYEKLIAVAALALSVGAVGIMLTVGGCASSDIDTTTPDSYLVITGIAGNPGEDGSEGPSLLNSDCWEDKTQKEPDPCNPGEERECCVVGSGIFHDDVLNVTVANNGKTGMEAQFQEVVFTSYRIDYHTAGAPFLPFFPPLPAEGHTVGDVVEGPISETVEIDSSTAFPVLAVPLERKPSHFGKCPIFLFPATLTLFGTDVSGESHSVSGSFQVHFANWLGTACSDTAPCGSISCIPLSVTLAADVITITEGETVTFTATALGGCGSIEFSWDFDGDGSSDLVSTPDSNKDVQAYIYSTDDTYTVEVTVTDSCPIGMQMDNATIVITVEPAL
jgi:hypothetical protein